MMDKFQKRYKHHQEKKKAMLSKVLTDRHSTRVFKEGEVDIKPILKMIEAAPSSCNRKAIEYSVIQERLDKELLNGLLVGGVGWIHRADKIVLLFANKLAYKAEGEINFMPYLDAGVIVQTAYLACEVNNIGCCYVNPNIRKENREFFNKRFNPQNNIFCGAIIMGTI